jgi:ribosome-associated toxin RatA of RatAB toxin-antitoxin module
MLPLYFAIGAVALVFVPVALVPSTGIIRRSIVIQKPTEEVFAFVADYQNYLRWNPWTLSDPEAQNTISTPSSGVGASWEWNGKKVGHGKLTTQQLVPGKSITSKLEFFKPFKGLAEDGWLFETSGSGTKVTWSYVGKLDYPMGKLFWVLFVKNMLTKQFDQGLAAIKTQVKG